MTTRAKLRNRKIEIINLLPFSLIISKNSRYVVRVTATAVFIRSPLYPDSIIPIPISTSQ